MSDEGYTLAEMLAALTILGMAIGGLGLVVSLIGRQQLAAVRIHARLVDDRAADQALTLWLDQQDAATLSGDTRVLSATCWEAQCEARLQVDKGRTVLLLRGRSGATRRLRLRQADVRFGYWVGGDVVQTLQRSEKTALQAGAPRAVVLTAGSGAAPLAVARIWALESRDCQFDAIIGVCRTIAP